MLAYTPGRRIRFQVHSTHQHRLLHQQSTCSVMFKCCKNTATSATERRVGRSFERESDVWKRKKRFMTACEVGIAAMARKQAEMERTTACGHTRPIGCYTGRVSLQYNSNTCHTAAESMYAPVPT